MANAPQLRVLLQSVGDQAWIAVGLERFIVAEGETQKQAAKQFHALLASEIAYGMRHRDREDPLSDIPVAPLSVFDAWHAATKQVPIRLSQMTVTVHGVTETEVRIPAPELREAA